MTSTDSLNGSRCRNVSVVVVVMADCRNTSATFFRTPFVSAYFFTAPHCSQASHCT